MNSEGKAQDVSGRSSSGFTRIRLCTLLFPGNKTCLYYLELQFICKPCIIYHCVAKWNVTSSLINMFLLKTIFKLTSLSSFLYARWIQNEKWKWKFLFDKRNMNHSLSTNRYSETRRKVEDLESSDNFRYWSSRIIHTAPRRYCWFHLISPRIESFGLMKFSIELRRPPFGGFYGSRERFIRNARW